jgi:hypothetical protein
VTWRGRLRSLKSSAASYRVLSLGHELVQMLAEWSCRDMPFGDIPRRRSPGDCSAGRRCHEMASNSPALALQCSVT